MEKYVISSYSLKREQVVKISKIAQIQDVTASKLLRTLIDKLPNPKIK